MQITGDPIGEVRAVSDMHQRKAEMARQADAFIALPGMKSWLHVEFIYSPSPHVELTIFSNTSPVYICRIHRRTLYGPVCYNNCCSRPETFIEPRLY